jgi:hypothetical protein
LCVPAMMCCDFDEIGVPLSGRSVHPGRRQRQRYAVGISLPQRGILETASAVQLRVKLRRAPSKGNSDRTSSTVEASMPTSARLITVAN